MLRERPIGTDGQQSRADLGQPVFRSGFVIFKDTAQPGGIDQSETSVFLKRGQLDIHDVDIFLITRIFSFRGKFCNVGKRHFRR